MSSQGRRSLLRRPRGALGAAPTIDCFDSARSRASQDATAGHARAIGGLREGGHSWVIIARASAVAVGVMTVALLAVAGVQADSGPPASTTPTSTTPDAPPPDPYHPPAKAPKPSATKPTAPVVHSAPVAPTRSYSPPATAPVAPVTPVRSVPRHRSVRPRAKKVVHKRKAHVVRKHVVPLKPVKVTFNPFANYVPAGIASVTTAPDRGRYLWLAGFAFALVAAAGMSLHVLSLRWFGARA